MIFRLVLDISLFRLLENKVLILASFKTGHYSCMNDGMQGFNYSFYFANFHVWFPNCLNCRNGCFEFDLHINTSFCT